MRSPPEDFLPTRESLLNRLRDLGDQESWQDFFDTYWKLIYSTARKAGLGDAAAQDIVQETIISVARHIEGFTYDPAVCSFKHWMLQLTRWRIINEWNKRQRQENRQSPLLPGSRVRHNSDETGRTATIDRIPDPAGLDLEALWDQEWEKNLLEAAMRRVKAQVAPEQVQLFDLYCVENWPARKVASTLGVSIGRVYLAKHRVGRLLKKELQLLVNKPLG